MPTSHAELPLDASLVGDFLGGAIRPTGTQSNGIAAEDRELVSEVSPTAASEDRRVTDQARQVLLAVAVRKSSDPAALRSHAGQDRAAAGSHGVARARPPGKWTQRPPRRGGV